MKGRIIIPEELQQQALEQWHSIHMGIKKIRLLASASIYWSNMNGYFENTIKHCSICLGFQLIQPKEKVIHHGIPGKLWKSSKQICSHYIISITLVL